MAKTIPATFHHTCFVVRDLEATAQRMADALGIGPWNIWSIAPERCRVNDEESPFSFRIALATVGGGTLELISPLSGRSVFTDHLREHGESFHHTCFVYSSLEAAREAKAELRRQGRKLIVEGSTGEVFDFAYFLFPEIGSLVEVLYLDAAKLPPPEVVVQPS